MGDISQGDVSASIATVRNQSCESKEAGDDTRKEKNEKSWLMSERRKWVNLVMRTEKR